MLFSMWHSFINAQKWRWLGLMILVFISMAWVIYHIAYGIIIQEAQNTARQQAELGRDTLQRVSQEHQPLLFAISIDKETIHHLRGTSPTLLNVKLKSLNDRAGLEAIYVMDRHGLTVAASNYADALTYLGNNYSFRPYFKEAIMGRSSDFFAIGATTGIPGYFISEPVYAANGEVIGVVAAKVGTGTFAQLWPEGGATGIVTDDNGIVILGSQQDWLYHSLQPLQAEQLENIQQQKQFSGREIVPLAWQFLPNNKALVGGRDYLYSQANMLVNGWQLHLLSETVDVQQRSALVAIILTAALFFVWAWALVIRSRRIKLALADSETNRSALAAVNVRLECEVAEHNLAQKELTKIQRQLIQSSRMAALGQLSASIIHELGQPMSALKTYLVAAELGPRSVEMDELLGNLQSVVGRMQMMTDELRDFSRPDKNPQTQVDFKQVVEQSKQLFELVSKEQTIALSCEYPRQSAWVLAHDQRLQQVVLNLLSNARSALQDVSNAQIRLKLVEEKDCWCLSVADNGLGFGDHNPKNLFEAFYTSHGTSDSIGLGLAICAAIVEEHHGKIEAKEQSSGGALFTVCLPSIQDPA
ncbi:MAG: sensor histidine kinase [Gammaproteobacteria bacterium]|nr:sensor histidine kinase [Gammaproteobacteria bacterium]